MIIFRKLGSRDGNIGYKTAEWVTSLMPVVVMSYGRVDCFESRVFRFFVCRIGFGEDVLDIELEIHGWKCICIW